MAYYRPKTPTELAEQRVQLLDEANHWRALTAMGIAAPTYIDAEATWASLAEANLWWVGADCCDLLAQAAPTMPPVTLDLDFVPDVHGFAFFERPITGRDAWHTDVTVTCHAIQWYPQILRGLPALAIIVWQYYSDPHLPPVPLGRSDWYFGFDTDHELDDDMPEGTMASIIEDRRLVAALWQLTTQTELVASAEERPQRAAAKRIVRKGYQPSPVRLVYLNRKTGRRNQPASTGTRQYSHRWTVKPHWRQQPYGPGRSLRRARYIDQYVKGPDDKPLRVRDSVKVWTKP